MTRTCSDCPAPISATSRGRCRSCAKKAEYANPESRRRMSLAKRRALADPEKRERVAIAAAENFRAWHRTTDRDWSTWHRERHRRQVEKAQREAAERARWEAMTPFERQLERVRQGARLVEKFQPRQRDYDFTLAGNATGMI